MAGPVCPEPTLSPRCLARTKPRGLKLKLPGRKSLGLTKPDIKKELNIITVLSDILYQKSKTFDNFQSKINKIHKDLHKIVSNF